MRSLKQIYLIDASVEKVWDALVNPKTIARWGAGPAKMSPDKGFEFSLWGGDVFGKNKEVIENKKLAQEWFGGNWDKPSLVVFDLKTKNNKTEVILTQKDIPDDEFKDIKEGWKEYYMNPLKEIAEGS